MSVFNALASWVESEPATRGPLFAPLLSMLSNQLSPSSTICLTEDTDPHRLPLPGATIRLHEMDLQQLSSVDSHSLVYSDSEITKLVALAYLSKHLQESDLPSTRGTVPKRESKPAFPRLLTKC